MIFSSSIGDFLVYSSAVRVLEINFRSLEWGRIQRWNCIIPVTTTVHTQYSFALLMMLALMMRDPLEC